MAVFVRDEEGEREDGGGMRGEGAEERERRGMREKELASCMLRISEAGISKPSNKTL